MSCIFTTDPDGKTRWSVDCVNSSGVPAEGLQKQKDIMAEIDAQVPTCPVPRLLRSQVFTEEESRKIAACKAVTETLKTNLVTKFYDCGAITVSTLVAETPKAKNSSAGTEAILGETYCKLNSFYTKEAANAETATEIEKLKCLRPENTAFVYKKGQEDKGTCVNVFSKYQFDLMDQQRNCLSSPLAVWDGPSGGECKTIAFSEDAMKALDSARSSKTQSKSSSNGAANKTTSTATEKQKELAQLDAYGYFTSEIADGMFITSKSDTLHNDLLR